MKRLLLRAAGVLACLCAGFPVARAAGTNPPPCLTVELCDGSRVVGSSLDGAFKFRSALLGEIKLDVADIRSVECVSSNLAKLATANGDTLVVAFAGSNFGLQTGFGRVDLAADSVRKITVSAARAGRGLHPAGLVALWSGENDARDSVGNNDGTWQSGVTFVPGKFGRAFGFDGGGHIKIPASQSLNVGLGEGFTFECWINPDNIASQVMTVFEWNDSSGAWTGVGCHLALCADGVIHGNVIDPKDGLNHSLDTPGNCVAPGIWQHIALTYDKTTGTLTLYRNGTVAASGDVGIMTPSTAFDFYLGERVAPGDPHRFQGAMDEIALYDRVLSASEIQAISKAGN